MEAVRARGDVPLVLARSTGVDVVTGRGLDEALVGVEAVVDVTNVQTLRRRTAEAFFEATTGNLLAAAQRCAVLGMRMPGSAGRDMATGGLLPLGEYEVGDQSFDEWLERAALGC